MKHKNALNYSLISPYIANKSHRIYLKERPSNSRRSCALSKTRLRVMTKSLDQLNLTAKKSKLLKSCARENRRQSAVSTQIENIMRKGSANSATVDKALQPLLQHVNTQLSLPTLEICAVSATLNGITDSRGKPIKTLFF